MEGRPPCRPCLFPFRSSNTDGTAPVPPTSRPPPRTVTSSAECIFLPSDVGMRAWKLYILIRSMIDLETFDEEGAHALAERLFWWKSPEEALANHKRFLAQVMSLGTWNDIEAARRLWPAADFRDTLREAPAGSSIPGAGPTGIMSSASCRFHRYRRESSRPANARPRHPAGFAIILLERREGHPQPFRSL